MAWTDEEHNAIVKALAVASEVTGADWSQPTCAFVLAELANAPASAVLTALRAAARDQDKLTVGRIREHVDAARARLRPRTTYEICGQSEGTVLAVFQTPAERRVPWMRRLVEDCTRAGIGDRYEILAAPARKALP